MKRLLSLLVLVMALAAFASTARAQDDDAAADVMDPVTFMLMDVNQRNVGSATLTDMGDMVELVAKVSGMNPNAGDRRIGLVNVGSCDLPDFASAGSAVQVFPNIQFFASGSADYKATVDAFDMSALYDADGGALVIYADVTVESGRIICGIVSPNTGTASDEGASDDDIADADDPSDDGASDDGASDDGAADDDMADDDVADDSDDELTEDELEEIFEEERTLEELLNTGAGALLYDVQGRIVGTAVMLEYNTGLGLVGTSIFIIGMNPVAGDHRTAVTDSATCEAPFESAGSELAQLPNVQFLRDGSAEYFDLTIGLSLESLFDEDGSALVLYADATDSTDRIICGPIVTLPDLLEGAGLTVDDVIADIEAAEGN